jgi:hypothetical protein
MSKRQNPIDEFEIHGVKTVGDYDYFLLIDADGECYIQKAASDDSLYTFAKMPVPAGTHLSGMAALINAFWASPESHTYKYLFEC